MKGRGMLRCSSAREGVDTGGFNASFHPSGNPPPPDGSSPPGPAEICLRGVLLKGELAVPFLGGLSLMLV